MYNTGLVDLEINLAALYILDSVADFHCNGSCLRVRHKSSWTENTAENTDLGHY